MNESKWRIISEAFGCGVAAALLTAITIIVLTY